MAVSINWGLLGDGGAGIVQNALTGYEHGQQMQQQRTQNALAMQDHADRQAQIAAEAERAARQESEQTAQRHRASAAQFFGALRRLPPEQRAQAAIDMARQNVGGWSEEEAARIADSVQHRTDWSDQALDGMIGSLGGNVPQPRIVAGRGGSYSAVDPYSGARVGGYDAPPEPPSPVEQARIRYYDAGVGLRGAQADRARRPAPAPAARGSGGGRRSRGGRGGAQSTGLPHGFVLE